VSEDEILKAVKPQIDEIQRKRLLARAESFLIPQ
jgi:hypothetical protein